jgi:hypothetical protein
MGTIMILYDIAFSYFSHRVLGVFAQAFVIYLQKNPLEFFKDGIHSM